MYCDKPQVNILTSLMLAHGIRHAVVCPGSRNAVIIHNFHEASLNLYPVTDERSAAFVAIGLWLRFRSPIVVCVTSGSALLNLLPGVAEAAYRHIPLVIVSADRPSCWIGQNDGQTIPQHGALKPYAHTWQLPDTDFDSLTEEQAWYTNRLVNEVLCSCLQHGGCPVHLNVPLSEPLFSFTTPELPSQRIIRSWTLDEGSRLPLEVMKAVHGARNPWIVIGQYEDAPIPAVRTLQEKGWRVMAEHISNHSQWADLRERDLPVAACSETPEAFSFPDLVLYFGGAFVGKQLKIWLRQCQAPVLRIDADNTLPDTFCHLTYKLCASPRTVLPLLVQMLDNEEGVTAAHSDALTTHLPSNSLNNNPHKQPFEALFLANSTAVRWSEAHIAPQSLAPFTFCNRGTNGIEGSLSVAAGYSLAAEGKVLCLTGDLSFFYDANSLFNVRLDHRLRIMVVNNGGGGIFHRLPGIDCSPALHDYISAGHPFSVSGIATSFRCTYMTATTTCLAEDFDRLVTQIFEQPSERPVVLEVFPISGGCTW